MPGEEFDLVMDEEEPLDLVMDEDDPLNIKFGESVIPIMKDDYNDLRNKPSINGVTLEGNKLMNDLFPDGLIIDGGDAGGIGE